MCRDDWREFMRALEPAEQAESSVLRLHGELDRDSGR